MTRPKLPSPAEFEADLRAIDRVLSELRELYRYAHGWSLGASVGDGASRVKSGEMSDPTSGIVISDAKTRARVEVRRAAKKAYWARNELYNARNALEWIVGPVSRQGARKPSADAIQTSAEFEAVKQAKIRRIERGEAIPE